MRIRWKCYTCADLAPLNTLTGSMMNSIKIAIVDDEKFLFLDNLRNSGYNICQLSDVENIDSIAAYDIVISDVNGVGKKLDETGQGLALIRQIRRRYPNKELGIYSGATHKIPENIGGVMVFEKDDSLDAWKEKIDSLIKKMGDPTNVWKKLCHMYIDHGIPSKTIAKIEDDYVYRVLHKKNFESFPSEALHIDKEVVALAAEIVLKILLV